MIAPNYDSTSPEDKILKNLQLLIDELSKENDISSSFCTEEHNNVDILFINDIINSKLSSEEVSSLSLMISKNSDNSLDVILDLI